ncbi:MAG TPA: hypothetical protein VLJ61_09045 [Pyrinomonadaceae bacterium]|nr:hypothetical protein [Pyrinomonadaceae bacterium]
MRKKTAAGETAKRPDIRVVEVHEDAGCEDDYLHTRGGVEFARGGQAVFASPEEAAEDERRRCEVGSLGRT